MSFLSYQGDSKLFWAILWFCETIMSSHVITAFFGSPCGLFWHVCFGNKLRFDGLPRGGITTGGEGSHVVVEYALKPVCLLICFGVCCLNKSAATHGSAQHPFLQDLHEEGPFGFSSRVPDQAMATKKLGSIWHRTLHVYFN